VDEKGVDPEGGTEESEQQGRERQQRTSIESVAQRAAPQRTADEQWQLDETDDADPQTRVCAFIHLVRNGDDGEVTAKY